VEEDKGVGHMSNATIYRGDALSILKTLPDESIQLVITSPPYYRIKDYGVEGQIGLEQSIHEYIDKLLAITSQIHRVLKKDGAFYLNIQDCYNSDSSAYQHGTVVGDKDEKSRISNKIRNKHQRDIKPKSLMGIPERLYIRMIDEQKWVSRNKIIWKKTHPKPSGWNHIDRFKPSWEYIYFFTKSPHYYFDDKAIRRAYTSDWGLKGNKDKSEKRNPYGTIMEDFIDIPPEIWTMDNGGSRFHVASFPESLPERAIRFNSREGDTVLDPFLGSGTTASASLKLNRNVIGIDLSTEYIHHAVNMLNDLGHIELIGME